MPRLCRTLKCPKRASFGIPGGPPVACTGHKEPGMVNVLSKRCDHPGGCATIPTFGHPGGSAARCSAHKEPGMIDVVSKRCDYPGGCNTVPSFGPPGGSVARCLMHREPGMVAMRVRRCRYPGGCDKVPSFGAPGGSAARCSEHREPGMVNVNAKRCDFPGGCSKVASFALPGSTARARCSTHREPGMISLKKHLHPMGAAASSIPHRSPAPEQDLATLAAAAGSSMPACGSGSEGMGGNLRDGAGEGPPAAAAVTFGGGLAPPLESGSRPALSRQHPASQPRLDLRAELPVGTAPCTTAPCSAAAARGSSRRRPRQEAQVGDNGREAVDSGGGSSKKPRGAGPAPPPQQAVQTPLPWVTLATPSQVEPVTGTVIKAEAPSGVAAVTAPPTSSSPSLPAPSPVPFSPGLTAATSPPASTPAPLSVPASCCAAAATAPHTNYTQTVAPPPALAPLSSVHVLEALLRRAVRLAVPLLPPPPPRRLVDSWLELWDGRMHELEEHLDMDVLSEGGLFQRRLAAAVAGGDARTCAHLMRMIQLLPEECE